jgi:hypothetical protein
MLGDSVGRERVVKPPLEELHPWIVDDRDCAAGRKGTLWILMVPIFGKALEAVESMKFGLGVTRACFINRFGLRSSTYV